jgi:hypothetical protein
MPLLPGICDELVTRRHHYGLRRHSSFLPAQGYVAIALPKAAGVNSLF